MARKWNYQKREYDQINLPDGASLFPDRANAHADMDKVIECAECGKRVISGDAYLSIRIKAENGTPYLVCHECHNIEWQEYFRQKDLEEIKNMDVEREKRERGKWILCSERLPEIDTDVLIYSKGYDASRIVAYLDGDNLQWYDSLSYVQIIKSDVIAWQPLPEPPKMDGGDEK